jgi:hypothetical protein
MGLAEAPIAPTLDVSACDGRTGERLQWLVERADSRELYADLWWRGWIGFYGVGAVFQGTRAGFENDEGKRADLIVSVAEGETLLRQAAKESEQRWDWKPHLFNVAVNVAGALIVTQAFDQKSGWTSAGIGIAVGEAMVWSHPWHGRGDLEDYKARFAYAPPRTSWALMPYERGLRLQVRF